MDSKGGLRTTRSHYGTGAELKFLKYLGMEHSAHNAYRPDLNRSNLDFKLSIEVKSSARNKYDMVMEQVRYAATAQLDFGGSASDMKLFDFAKMDSWRDVMSPDVAFYYLLVHRVDELVSDDVIQPHSGIKLSYSQACLIPSELALMVYAINFDRRGNVHQEVDASMDNLMSLVLNHIHSGRHPSELRRIYGRRSWENIGGSLIKALCLDEPVSEKAPAQKFSLDRIRNEFDPFKTYTPHVQTMFDGAQLFSLIKPEHQAVFETIFAEAQEGDEEMREVAAKRLELQADLYITKHPDFLNLYANGGLLHEHPGAFRRITNLTQKKGMVFENLVRWNLPDTPIDLAKPPPLRALQQSYLF